MRALILLLCVAFGSGCNNTTSAIDALEPARDQVAAPAPAPGPGSPACGQKGAPDCPLQGWMKSTLQAYQRAGNYARLESSLKELAEHTPAGFESWKTLALRGALAAAAQDDAAVRRACKECHEQNRSRYRRELRANPTW